MAHFNSGRVAPGTGDLGEDVGDHVIEREEVLVIGNASKERDDGLGKGSRDMSLLRCETPIIGLVNALTVFKNQQAFNAVVWMVGRWLGHGFDG